MRRVLVALITVVLLLGIGTIASAQGGVSPITRYATPTCGSPVSGTPIAASTPLVVAASPVSATPDPCALQPNGFMIEAVDLAFKPNEATIPANTDVALTFHNGGVALHNFTIDSLDISIDVVPGQTAMLTINAPAGDYEFYCAIPGHRQAGMVGILHVR